MKKIFSFLLSFWSDVTYIGRRELKTAFHDEGVLIFFFLVPLLYPLLYGYIYNTEVVREVPVLAVDESHSQTGREFLRRLDATPDVRIVAHLSNMGEARAAMARHEAFGVVRLPSDFSRRLHRGEQTVAGVYADMSGMLYYKAILMAATQVSLDMNSRVKLERIPGSTTEQSKLISQPVRYEEVSLFNPTAGYGTFLVPAVLMLIIQQTLLLGIGMSTGTDRDRNRFHDLVPIDRHFGGAASIVLGKGLSYLLLYLPVCVWVGAIVPKLFGYVSVGHAASLSAFLLPYLLACIFFSMTLSYFVHERETAMLLFVFTSVPFLFLSGISWPWYAVPRFWQWVASVVPSTFGVNGFVRINGMGADLHQTAPLTEALWIQALVYALLSTLLYHRQTVLSRRHIVEAWKRQKARMLVLGLLKRPLPTVGKAAPKDKEE